MNESNDSKIKKVIGCNILILPAALVSISWLWYFLAWENLEEIAHTSEMEREKAIFWASNLPLGIFLSLAVFLGLTLTVYVVVRRREWQAIPLFFSYAFAAVAILIGYVLFNPFPWVGK